MSRTLTRAQYHAARRAIRENGNTALAWLTPAQYDVFFELTKPSFGNRYEDFEFFQRTRNTLRRASAHDFLVYRYRCLGKI